MAILEVAYHVVSFLVLLAAVDVLIIGLYHLFTWVRL